MFPERFIIDLSGTVEPDELPPARSNRFQNDVEMGVKQRRIMFRALGVSDARRQSMLVSLQQLWMDEFTILPISEQMPSLTTSSSQLKRSRDVDMVAHAVGGSNMERFLNLVKRGARYIWYPSLLLGP